MEDYIANVKEHIVGQGEVMELDLEDLFPPPPSQEFLDQLSGQMGQLNTGDLNPTSPGGTLVADKSYNPQLLAGPKPYGSTSSSLSSSRNATPSPTSGSEEHHHLGHGEIPKLSRPSRFGGGPGAAAQISPLGHHSSTHHPGHSSSHQVQAEINPRSPGGSASCASIAAGLSSNRPSAPGTTTCMGCSLTLKPGDVAVKAERAGPGKLWHPQCFKCHTCEVTRS